MNRVITDIDSLNKEIDRHAFTVGAILYVSYIMIFPLIAAHTVEMPDVIERDIIGDELWKASDSDG